MKRTVLFLFLVTVLLNGYSQVQTVYVESAGEGQAVIFLPGFTNPGHIWKEFAPSLEGEIQAHYVTYAALTRPNRLNFPGIPK